MKGGLAKEGKKCVFNPECQAKEQQVPFLKSLV